MQTVPYSNSPFLSFGGAYDPAAQAFFSANPGVTDTSQKNAVNRLVLDLKAASLFTPTKIQALWPVVGGTADAHRYNLLDPSTFLLAYGAGITHGPGGLRGDGTGMVTTGYLPNRDMTGDTLHLGLYVRDLAVAQWDMGAVQAGDVVQGLIINRANGLTCSDIGNDGTYTTGPTATSPGFFVGSRTAANAHALYANGSLIGTNNGTTPTPVKKAGTEIALCGTTGVTDFSTKQVALASVGPGLSVSEVAAYAAAVQTFQTALGRQV